MAGQLELWQYLAVLFACHNIGDFAFQSAWMAECKANADTKVINREVLFYHVVTQASPFMLLAVVPGFRVTWYGLLIHMMLHATVDYLKGKGHIKKIWQDQLCHYVCTVAEHLLGLI